MSVCGGWSLVNHRGREARVITLWCRAWSCPDCGPRRRSALRALAHRGNPSKFLTLTIRDRDADNAAQAQLLSTAFKNLIKRWRRLHRGREIEYLAVFEPHPSSGRPHLHVIMRAPYTPQKWISKQMDDLLDSPVADIRAVSGKHKIANYISKYITKANTRFGTMKRYWHSKGWDQGTSRVPRDKNDYWGRGWDVIRSPIFVIADWWRVCGLTVQWHGEHEARAGPRAEGGVYYATPPWELEKK